MAQEKWEKEGKIGTAYDREFRLLNTDEIERPLSLDFNDRKVEENKTPADIKTEKTWPLGSPLASPGAHDSRPGTSGTGRYTTMPKITAQQAPQTPTTEKPQERLRLPEPQEDEKKEKGCCCIVM